MKKFGKSEIGKTIIYWPIEDAEKDTRRKCIGEIVEVDEEDGEFVKVLRDKKPVDVHVGQMINIF